MKSQSLATNVRFHTAVVHYGKVAQFHILFFSGTIVRTVQYCTRNNEIASSSTFRLNNQCAEQIALIIIKLKKKKIDNLNMIN